MVSEANLIAVELKRKIKFGVKMVRIMPEFGTLLITITTSGIATSFKID